jgi:hypothetical protein
MVVDKKCLRLGSLSAGSTHYVSCDALLASNNELQLSLMSHRIAFQPYPLFLLHMCMSRTCYFNFLVITGLW